MLLIKHDYNFNDVSKNGYSRSSWNNGILKKRLWRHNIAFKDSIPSIQRCTSPHSNLAEVIHSSQVSTKRTHLSIYECTLEYVAEFATIKQMLKGYQKGNFCGSTGPSYMQINSRKDARNIKAFFTVIEEDSFPIHYNDENDGFHHQGSEDLNQKAKPRKLLKMFHHQSVMIVLMKHHSMT